MKKKIGLLGLGHLGKIHLRLLKEIPEWDLVGIYDIDTKLAKRVGEEFQVKVYENLNELIAAVDAIDIVTPTLSHFDLAMLAMQAGKHVFIEKPITHLLEDAKTLMELAKEKQLVAQVGHVERFNPAFLAIENRHLDPKFIEVHRLAKWNPRGTDVSVVLDLMIHDLDIVLSIVKSPIKQVQASGTAVISDSIDICNARIEFENGCVANITTSRVSFQNMRKIRFFQPNSYFSLDLLEKKTEIIHLHPANTLIQEGQIAFDFDTGKETKQMTLEIPAIPSVNAIKQELEEFAAAIIKGEPVRVSFEDGYKALEAAYRVVDRMNQSFSV